MEKKESAVWKQILVGLFLLIGIGMVCLLVYKAQIREHMSEPVYCTLMSEHKENKEAVLREDTRSLSEQFVCKVPELCRIMIEGRAENISSEARVEIILSDTESGQEYYHREKAVSEIFTEKAAKVKLKLNETQSDSQDKNLTLTVSLINAGETHIYLTANSKPGIVSSFNQDTDDHTNVIWSLEYSSCENLKILYIILCVSLLGFGAVCYWMLIIRKREVEHFFIPISFYIGVVFQCVVCVYGVPDEPWHMDTAYKYSNKMLCIEDTGEYGVIYKRQCDVEMTDMLANGVESNSFYQLLHHTFELPQNKELVKVAYVDTGDFVPDIVYFPAAIGISIGRLFGLSALLTLQLGRILSLLVYIILAWFAIRIVPFGKNVFGMVGMLPITLQQGASASYDAMLNGILFLFLALCFRMSVPGKYKKWEIGLTALLAVFILISKGGVYIPVLAMLLLIFHQKRSKKETKETNEETKKRRRYLLILCGVMAVLICVAAVKTFPAIKAIFTSFMQESEANTQYTIPYLIRSPLKIIYLYWNTFMEKADDLLRGLLGGMLAWHDVKINWSIILIFLIGLLLLTNVKGDKYEGGARPRLIITIAAGVSIALIMMSMLLGVTPIGSDYIQGIQGRYFLPLAPMMFMITSNNMIVVQKKQCGYVWLTMMAAEVMVVLQCVALTA